MAKYGVSWWLAVIIAMIAGVVVGLGIGVLVAKVGIPSFVVTLAFFLAFQGLQLLVIGEGGLYRVESSRILQLENGNLPVAVGWILGVATIVFVFADGFMARRRRAKTGHTNRPISVLYVRTTVIGVAVIASVYFLNLERSSNPNFPIRGVPIAVLFVAGLLILGTFLLSRTKFGIHVYAVGGNPEGARRAGIRIGRLRIFVFMIGSGLAALSGLLSASRIGAVDASAGRVIVLSGVAAAVVGGVSLFGGRGRLSDAVIGGLVIAVIDNGLGLLNLPSGLNLAVTGSVLLAAATADALSRKHGTVSMR
jgi:D-xylose transport system permease protein